MDEQIIGDHIQNLSSGDEYISSFYGVVNILGLVF